MREIVAGQQIGQYTVINQLGQGGMSNVFLARDTEHERDVVLKFPHEEMMGDIATHERFKREVKIGQILDHPNIQRLYELAELRNSPFLVLEYVPGGTLRKVLRDRPSHRSPDDFRMAAELGTQLAGALTYAHAHHVAHRDLKPENIIVTPEGVAKVMDFGIAFVRGARRVTWGPMSSQVGTPDYMAPEQIQGGRGDDRTDIYALGMILYEYLSGHMPYHGDNALSIMNQHVTVKPPSLSHSRPDVPAGLEEVIMKAIRRRPEDRWQTMEEFSQALNDPSIVDASALRAEREAEPGESLKAAKLAGKIGMPAGNSTIITAAVVVVLLAIVVIAAQVFGHPGHH